MSSRVPGADGPRTESELEGLGEDHGSGPRSVKTVPASVPAPPPTCQGHAVPGSKWCQGCQRQQLSPDPHPLTDETGGLGASPSQVSLVQRPVS